MISSLNLSQGDSNAFTLLLEDITQSLAQTRENNLLKLEVKSAQKQVEIVNQRNEALKQELAGQR